MFLKKNQFCYRVDVFGQKKTDMQNTFKQIIKASVEKDYYTKKR